jgi:hypothetical protein
VPSARQTETAILKIKRGRLAMAKITPAGNVDYNNEIDKLLKQIEGNYGTHKSARRSSRPFALAQTI